MRAAFVDLPDLEARFGRPSYFTLKTPIEVIIFGDDLDDLRAHSLEIAARLAGVPGLVDVRSSLEAGNPELQVVFDRERLAALGLDMGVLSETLQEPRPGRGADALQGGGPADRHPPAQPRERPPRRSRTCAIWRYPAPTAAPCD